MPCRVHWNDHKGPCCSHVPYTNIIFLANRCSLRAGWLRSDHVDHVLPGLCFHAATAGFYVSIRLASHHRPSWRSAPSSHLCEFPLHIHTVYLTCDLSVSAKAAPFHSVYVSIWTHSFVVMLAFMPPEASMYRMGASFVLDGLVDSGGLMWAFRQWRGQLPKSARPLINCVSGLSATLNLVIHVRALCK